MTGALQNGATASGYPQSTGTIIVPAFNEADVIGPSLSAIGRTLVTDLGDRRWEILVVDDGSVDGTAELAELSRTELEAEGIELVVLRHQGNRGLGVALQTAFAACRGDVVVVVDCDLSYEPSHISRMVTALLDSDAQIVLASPYMVGGRTVGVPPAIERRSRMANAFLATIGKTSISTMTGMVRAYRGPFIRALSLKSIDVEINIETVYKAELLRAKVIEIPATLDWSGLTSRSSRNRLRSRRTRWKVYRTILSGILFRPYLLFLATGLVTLGLGVLLLIAALAVPDAQTVLTTWCACAFSTGLVLGFGSLLSLQMKRYFDELFVQGFRMRRWQDAHIDVAPPQIPDRRIATASEQRMSVRAI